MNINKWNYNARRYDKTVIPNDWNVKVYVEDFDEIINCPHCGEAFRCGDGFTSLEIHTDIGLGYIVCKSCYEKEWLRRKDAE